MSAAELDVLVVVGGNARGRVTIITDSDRLTAQIAEAVTAALRVAGGDVPQGTLGRPRPPGDC